MHNNEQIKIIIFDWGNTLMVDFPQYKGAMFYWSQIKLMPNVLETLKLLYKKIPLCVATNAGDSNTELMIKALERGGIKHFFDYFFSSNDAGYSKPDPRFFTALTNFVNVAPNNCLMIGNDYEKDIVGAANVGMKTLFYNYLKIDGNFSAATEIFYDFIELPNMKSLKSVIGYS